MAGAKLVGGAMKYGHSLAASSKAMSLGEKNKTLIGLQTREEMRRLKATQDSTVGDAKAAIASSGFKPMGGSNDQFLSDLETEFKNQRDWLTLSGAKKEEIAMATAESVASGIKTQGQSEMIAGVTQAASIVGDSQDWWAK